MAKVNLGKPDFSNGVNDYIDRERIRELRLKRPNEDVQRAEDRINLTGGKHDALTQLDNMITKVRSSRDSLKLATLKPIKTSVIATSDVGVGTDYLTVNVGDSALLESTNIQINAIATSGYVRVVSNNFGLHFDQNVLAFNQIIINGGAGAINIAINNGVDTLATVANNINNDVNITGQNLRAEVLTVGVNQYELVIRSTVTGLRTITAQMDDGILPLNVRSSANIGEGADGLNAQITVIGRVINQASNEFLNILPGVSITALKQNIGVQAQTISVIKDPKAMSRAANSFIENCNDILAFLAKQQQRVKVGEAFKPAEGSFLTDSLSSIETLKIISSQILAGSPGASLKTLKAIGIDYIKIPATDDTPEIPRFDISDADLFKKSVTDNWDNVQKLFLDDMKITPVGAVSSLAKSNDISKILPTRVLGRDITIAVGVVGGVANAVTFDLNDGNGAIPGVVAGGIITFPGTDLEGLQLIFNPLAAPNGNENFTLNMTQGIADRIKIATEQPLVKREKDLALTELGSDQKRLEKAKARLATKTKQLEKSFQKMDIQSFRAFAFNQLLQAQLAIAVS